METWDKITFEKICERHRLETESPIVMAEMVQFEKKLNQMGVKTIFMFPGYGEITRFMKSRFGLMQPIHPEIANSSKSYINSLFIILINTKIVFSGRFGELFEGKNTVSELMDDINIRLCAPVNTPSGMNRPHNIKRSDGFKYRSNGIDTRKTVPCNVTQEHMFEAFIDNVSIDTFDCVLVNIDKSVYNPVREYLWAIPTGWLGASLIGQTCNPHIVQSVQNSYRAKDFGG